MEINNPDIVAEVSAAFDRYEDAVTNNRPEVLSELFWDDRLTLRYGVAENLHGHREIAEYRTAQGRKGGPARRTLQQTIITTYGRNFATANTEFVRVGGDRIGRQSQTWARMPEGWHIVAAHVSFMQDSD
jgi:hypothetical protein